MADEKKVSVGVITRNYIIALLVIAVLSIVAMIIMILMVSAQSTSAAEINVSGRQRMLSQRISMLSLRLVLEDDPRQQSKIRAKLKSAINLMKEQHEGLINGNKDLNLSGDLSAKEKEIFFEPPIELDKQVKTYLAKANNIASTPNDELTSDNENLQFVLTAASVRLITSLDKAVGQFQDEADGTVITLQVLHVVIFGIILLVLLLEGLIIFRPMTRRIKLETDELADAYDTQRVIASTLQKSLVPQKIPKIKDLDIEIFYRSATKMAEVGGDFYDVFQLLDDRWGIVMGDVSGKGIDAAAETAKVKYLLRDRAYTGLEPNKVLASINETLVTQKTELFTVLTYGVYDPKKAILTLTNSGNPYPYWAKQDRFLEITSVPMAVLPDQSYPSISIKFEKNDLLIMYTDGLVEAKKNSDLYGEERVRAFVKKHSKLDLKKLLNRLVEEAKNFSGDNLTDDMLIIGLRKK
ncbi:hypothetical protein LCGC14_0526920 [marine sediment metagenome]|uniref:PPM-type phosphatase domain-containing protein n=1 Tax=marine sediment metagenome TaxID=412755 RepID=A0A0F9RX04_9ZZZZ|nr:hypothetical protein [Actinomycetota bacterium]